MQISLYRFNKSIKMARFATVSGLEMKEILKVFLIAHRNGTKNTFHGLFVRTEVITMFLK